MQWFAITVGRGTPEWPLLRLCRNSPPDLTPPFITVCRWFARRHDLMPPYGKPYCSTNNYQLLITHC